MIERSLQAWWVSAGALVAVASGTVRCQSTGPAVQPLPTVSVTEMKPSRVPGFDDRRQQGHGRFLDRDELEKWAEHRTSEVFATVPGVVVKYAGTKVTVATSRAVGGDKCAFCRSPTTDLLDEVDISAGARPACYMDIYLDGGLVYQYGRTPPQPLFNLNDLPPTAIEAIEVYSSTAQVPVAYNRTSSGCGVVLIWTRRSP